MTDAAARGETLAEFYRRIHATMRDAGLCNEALAVEAIGFRDFGPYVLGVMVTPWFANLVVTAPSDETTERFPASMQLKLRFPAGDVDFNVSEIEGFGPLASCSLFSPMDEFADHEAARTAAGAALEALLDPALHETPKREPEPANGLDRRALFGRRRRGAEEAAP